MKKLIILTCLVGLGLVMWSGLVLAADNMPGPDGAALWKYITQTSPYEKWGEWPDHVGILPGRAPHGPFNKVYVNDTLINTHKAPAPDGSIEVKVSYKADKSTVSAYTVMYKIKGYNPKQGDWFWALYGPDGQVKKAGKLYGCMACHGGAMNNDSIMVHVLN